ncbi:MAG: porin [Schleiferiaceae bacterium]|nr:porin [Schleiferiaceae bacterium]
MERYSGSWVLTGIQIVVLLFCLSGYGQEQNDAWELRFFGDTYINFDLNDPEAPQITLPYLFNHTQANQLSENILVLEAKYKNHRFRGNLGLMIGDYVFSNLSHEPKVFRNFYTANFGIALDTKQTLWLDVGVFESHIGAEGLIQHENLTLTRSIAAENSPYYLSGMRFTKAITPQFQVAFLVLNGWQELFPQTASDMPSFGTQVSYSNQKGQTWNYSTYHGQERVMGEIGWRSFHNFYFQQNDLFNRFDFLMLFDVGVQHFGENAGFWYTPQIVARARLVDEFRVYGRAELFRDSKGIIIPIRTMEQNIVYSFAAGIQYGDQNRGLLKLEFRYLSSAYSFREPSGFIFSTDHLLNISYSFYFTSK